MAQSVSSDNSQLSTSYNDAVGSIDPPSVPSTSKIPEGADVF